VKLHYLRVLPEIKELPADVKEPVSVPAGDLWLVLKAIPEAGVNRRSPEWWRLWLQVALFTGARRGELFGLTWRSIDWATKTVTIACHTSKGRKDRHYEDAVDLIRVLREWFESQPGSPVADDPVFPWPYASPRQFYFDWAKIIAAAGVEYFKPHNLRSSAVSELGEDEELIAVRDWVGHQSVKTTERFYSNTRNARRRIARRRKVIE
jgi:integrase